MENKFITKKIIKSNGHEFEETSFYDISVIKHVETGYYNANHICKSNKNKFENIKRNQYWDEYSIKLKENSKISADSKMSQHIFDENTDISFEILDVSNEFRGTYIHPLLLNFLCEHVDYNYAIKISYLMLLQNEEINLRNMTLEDKIIEVEETVEALKENKEIQNNIITKQNEMINTYKQTIDLNNDMIKSYEETIKLNNELINKHKKIIESQIFDIDILNRNIKKYNDELQNKNKLINNKCVNTKTDSRKFRVYDITQYKKNEKQLNPFDDKCIWKVSASQRNKFKYPVILEVILVSSMHARIDIKQHLYSKIINRKEIGNVVKQSSKEYIYNYIINDLKPKSIIIDNIKNN